MPVLVPNHILMPHIASLLDEGKEVLFTPSGNSMRPYIEGSLDSVILKKMKEVKVGDICLVRIPIERAIGYRYVLHRVIKIHKKDITLMGDGNLEGTESTTTDDVLGTVIEIRSPKGHTKPLTRGKLWYRLRKWRWLLLKIYRHTIVKYSYSQFTD